MPIASATRWTLLFAAFIFPNMAPAQSAAETQGTATNVCPVTRAEHSFVPPNNGHNPPGGGLYFGTSKLWVLVDNGPWRALPRWDIGYRNKIVWWSAGYDWKAEPKPALEISGRRLDGSAPPLVVTV